MIRLMVLAAVPLMAAMATAQAADPMSGRVTFIDPAAGSVVLDNHQTAFADIKGLQLGQTVTLAAMVDEMPVGAINTTGSRPAAAPEQSVSGRLTYADARTGRIAIDNMPFMLAPGVRLGNLGLGQAVNAALAGPEGFTRVARLDMLAVKGDRAARLTSGHITFIDRDSGAIIVNNMQVTVPGTLDLTKLRVGDRVKLSYALDGTVRGALRLALN
jgi:hypothetical protein